LPAAAMFANESGRNEQSKILYREPSIDAF
jgi:hypothetical protein